MEQTALFPYFVFICVMISMGAVASAALLQSSSSPSLAPLGVSLRSLKPVVKGKVFEAYSFKLLPTRSNGKVVGDRGASGKLWLKGIKTQKNAFYYVQKLRLDNIRSGGAFSHFEGLEGQTCLDGKYVVDGVGVWTNITTQRGGQLKRYSFVRSTFRQESKAEVKIMIQNYLDREKSLTYVVSHPHNNHALCRPAHK